MKRDNKTCMSYWFPKIEAAGLPVPKTMLLTLPDDMARDIWSVFDGDEPSGLAEPFFAEIARAAESVGYPCFLRTGLTSGKHEWKRCCYLTKPEDIKQHVVNLIEFSELCDMMGLPSDVWAVREFLPTMPVGVCPYYGDMPICREFRFFVNDGALKCWHGYWPKFALERGGAVYQSRDFDYEAFCRPDDLAALTAVACAAGRAVGGGAWSVDLLETRRGWVLTDMAEADRSWHWEGCEKAGSS